MTVHPKEEGADSFSFGTYTEDWMVDAWTVQMRAWGNPRLTRLWCSKTIVGYDAAKALLDEIYADVSGWLARHPDAEAALMAACV